MSVRMMSEVWAKYRGGAAKKLVLLAIADHANDDGEAWPSVDLIALKCDVSRRYVSKLTAELCDEGWLEIEPPTEQRQTNTYRVVIPDEAVDVIAERRAALKAKQRQAQQQQRGDELLFMGGMNHSSSKPSLEPSVNVDLTKVKSTRRTSAPRRVPTSQQELLPLQGEKDSTNAARNNGTNTHSPPPAPPLTPAQRVMLDCFGAKKFKTKTQRDTIAALEQQYGFEPLKAKIEWAAKVGMSMGKAVVAVETALTRPNGRQRGPSADANPGKARVIHVDPANIYDRKDW